MAKNTVHVVPRDGAWAVRRSEAERDSSHHRAQEAAIRSGCVSGSASSRASGPTTSRSAGAGHTTHEEGNRP